MAVRGPARDRLKNQPVAYDTWAPDAAVVTDGAVQDAFNYFPIQTGFRTFPGQRALGRGLQGPCMGSFSDLLLATPVFAAATANALYIGQANGDLKLLVAGFQNKINRWRFVGYGTPTQTPAYQDLIAVNGVDLPQRYQLGTGLWSPLPNGSVDNSVPPVASIVEASDYALILVLPNSQQFLSTQNESAPSWNLAGSVPYQVYVQPISQSPGNITAAKRLRDQMVFYKPGFFHLAAFVGGTTGWAVAAVSGKVGVLNQEWVISTGDAHFFPSTDGDFYSFDGYSLNGLSNQLSEFFRNDINYTYRANIAGQFDVQRNLLIWSYSSTSANPAGSLDTQLIYYLRTGKWCFQRTPVQLPMSYLNPTTLQRFTGNFLADNVPHVYDDSIMPQRSYITSNFFGDYHWMYDTSRVRVGFSVLPQSATLTPIVQGVGGQIPKGPPGDYALMSNTKKEPLTTNGWFDLVTSGCLTAFQLVTQGLAEVVEIEPLMMSSGEI